MAANLRTCQILRAQQRSVETARVQVRRLEQLNAKSSAESVDAASVAADRQSAREILAIMEEGLGRLHRSLPSLDDAAWQPVDLPLSAGDIEAMARVRRRKARR